VLGLDGVWRVLKIRMPWHRSRSKPYRGDSGVGAEAVLHIIEDSHGEFLRPLFLQAPL